MLYIELELGLNVKCLYIYCMQDTFARARIRPKG